MLMFNFINNIGKGLKLFANLLMIINEQPYLRPMASIFTKPAKTVSLELNLLSNISILATIF